MDWYWIWVEQMFEVGCGEWLDGEMKVVRVGEEKREL